MFAHLFKALRSYETLTKYKWLAKIYCDLACHANISLILTN